MSVYILTKNKEKFEIGLGDLDIPACFSQEDKIFSDDIDHLHTLIHNGKYYTLVTDIGGIDTGLHFFNGAPGTEMTVDGKFNVIIVADSASKFYTL